MTERSAIFIDGAYLASVLKSEFNSPRVDFHALSSAMRSETKILRTYYYHCLPHQSDPPSAREKERLASARRFFVALRMLPRFEVRLGRLERRGEDVHGKTHISAKTRRHPARCRHGTARRQRPHWGGDTGCRGQRLHPGRNSGQGRGRDRYPCSTGSTAMATSGAKWTSASGSTRRSSIQSLVTESRKPPLSHTAGSAATLGPGSAGGGRAGGCGRPAR